MTAEGPVPGTRIPDEDDQEPVLQDDETIKGMMEMMKNMIESYEKRLDIMQNEIKKQSRRKEDDEEDKLKPICIKDLKPPENMTEMQKTTWNGTLDLNHY